MKAPPALLLVGHGSPDEEGAESFRSFVGELAERDPETPVAGGFVGRSPLPLADAVAELAARGVREFAAVPLTLVAEGHSEGDLPAALARERERHPGTSYVLGRPPGPHPDLLSVLERRVEEALDGDARRSPGDRAGTTVLLVGRGSTDPGANSEVHKAARLLWEGSGYAGVEVAFVSLAAPDVASGLDRCRKLGAEKVVVLPCFVFTGALSRRTRMHAEGWSRANPGVDVVDAGVLGGTGELADLVMERYREAAGGEAYVDCDACGHRVRVPGAEDGNGHPHGGGDAPAP